MFNKNRKIKNYFILPRFQFTLIFLNLFIMTCCLGLVFYQIEASFNELIYIGEKLKLDPNSAFFRLLSNQKGAIQEKLYIAAIISYVLSFWATIIVSHKVSGPIYRLKMYFKDISSNGLSAPLKFRDRDYYHDLADTVNDGIDKIKK